MLTTFKRFALFSAFLLAPASFLHAGPYPGSLPAHSHTSPSQGGVLANPTVTKLTVGTTLQSPVAIFGTMTTTETATFSGPVVVSGTTTFTGPFQFPSSATYQGRNRISNGDFLYDSILGGAPITCSGATCNTSADISNGWSVVVSSVPGTSITYAVGNVDLINGDAWFPFIATGLNSDFFTRGAGLNYTFASGTTLYPDRATFFQTSIDAEKFKDFRFGTSNAATLTLSFWAFTTAGTYTGSLMNAAKNRAYPFTWSQSVNVWEYKTITIPGDTGGTWNSGSGPAALLNISYLVGSNYSGTVNTWNNREVYGGTSTISQIAQIAITGVQLEKGIVASPFEYRDFQTAGERLNSPIIGSTSTISTTQVGVRISTNGEVALRGTKSNDSAASGDYGEYASTVTASATSVQANGSWGDLLALTLSPGDWDVTSIIIWNNNGATWTRGQSGISTTSGDNSTGLTFGLNHIDSIWASSSSTPVRVAQTIPRYRLSVNTSTTIYLKYICAYSAGSPVAYGSMTARRVR